MSGESSFIILFILTLKKVVDRMLPCSTPSWFFKSDRVDPMCTWKVLAVKKFLINFGYLPFSLRSYRSFMIPNFHVVSISFF